MDFCCKHINLCVAKVYGFHDLILLLCQFFMLNDTFFSSNLIFCVMNFKQRLFALAQVHILGQTLKSLYVSSFDFHFIMLMFEFVKH